MKDIFMKMRLRQMRLGNKKIVLLFFMLVLVFIFYKGYEEYQSGALGRRKTMTDIDIKKAQGIAESYWGKGGPKEVKVSGEFSYVKSVKLQESREIKNILKGYKVFGVEAYNPVCQIAGPGFFNYSLIINRKDGTPHYLEDDEQVVRFLSDLSIKAINKKIVDDILFVFASLRGYSFCEKPGSFAPNWYGDEFLDEDWETVINKWEDGWDIMITFLVDPDISAYCRYKFVISKTGQVNITMIKRTSRSGYR